MQTIFQPAWHCDTQSFFLKQLASASFGENLVSGYNVVWVALVFGKTLINDSAMSIAQAKTERKSNLTLKFHGKQAKRRFWHVRWSAMLCVARLAATIRITTD